MQISSPRAWPWSAASSPEPFPEHAWMQTLSAIHPLIWADLNTELDLFTHEQLVEWLNNCEMITEDGNISIQKWLEENNKAPINERIPFILCGELGNPHRLVDLGISGMPIVPIRMDGICRVWTDVIDGREVSPGIHHVTLARTKGWWECTWLGFASKDDARKMTEWLNDGFGTNWRWSTLAEGKVSIHMGEKLYPPSENMISWDGSTECVEGEIPETTGPEIELSALKAILFTRQGCYDNRGRLARCAHIKQRQFHDSMFRRGSSKQWNEIIDIA